VMDAVGSNIRVDSRGREVLRILPVRNEGVNEEWIADKTRFVWDGLRRQRLDRPYIRKGGQLQSSTWEEAFQFAADKVKSTAPEKIGAIIGDLVPSEAIKALKDLTDKIGTPHRDCRQDGMVVGGGARSDYLFNTSIEGLEKADSILIVGSNPRIEAPLINARIRKAWLSSNELEIGVIGEATDLAFEYQHLGNDPAALKSLLNGDTAFMETMKRAERPVIIVGAGALSRSDSDAILAVVKRLVLECGVVTEHWNGFNVLHSAASRVGALDLGFLPGESGCGFNGILDAASAGDIGVVYNLGADEFDARKLNAAFVIYQGHHGDAGARFADVIFPSAAYTEQNGIYVNTEGRAQLANRAVNPPGMAREDWAILRAFSDYIDRSLPYDDLAALRAAMFEDAPTMGQLNHVTASNDFSINANETTAGEVSSDLLVSAIGDYYMTNAIARASQTMAECSQAANGIDQIAAE
ncbi:MAG: molybdopterin-dependent oxidoreductase, partial [Marinicaulis sp.]|nr:molybdopterin-dependent oxidoreductase [Marinicaulis sp.]